MQLEDEQYKLLAKFVEAHRSTSPESRGAFIASQTHNQPEATFLHSRVHDLKFQGSVSDAEILADMGFLRRSHGSGDAPLFSVLPQGIEAYEKNLASPPGSVSAEPRRSSGISVFISHSHQDTELVKRLVTLLRSALNLQSSQIRATSLDGFRLPGGSNTNEQLRTEVQDSKVLIGVISSSSLRSAYVTFELGARWGSGKPMIPLLAHDVGPESLAGPLQGITALSCRTPGQLHQLVEDVASHLNAALDSPAAYQKCVDEIVEIESGIRPAVQLKPGDQPKVEIEGPPSAPLGKTTYFRILTENVDRIKWSIGGFQNIPVVVEPVGPVHEIYVEPTEKARVKHQFQIVVDAYSSDGRSARATRTFMVVSK